MQKKTVGLLASLAIVAGVVSFAYASSQPFNTNVMAERVETGEIAPKNNVNTESKDPKTSADNQEDTNSSASPDRNNGSQNSGNTGENGQKPMKPSFDGQMPEEGEMPEGERPMRPDFNGEMPEDMEGMPRMGRGRKGGFGMNGQMPEGQMQDGSQKVQREEGAIPELPGQKSSESASQEKSTENGQSKNSDKSDAQSKSSTSSSEKQTAGTDKGTPALPNASETV